MDQIKAPAVVFPGQLGELAGAYRSAYDLLARKSPREALDLLDPALAEDPRNTGLRVLRAWAYSQRAQLVKAEEELTGLVEENPGDDWMRHTLGRVLERQSRYAEALPHLRLAAAMSGDVEHETAVLRVERTLAERGERSFDDLV